MLPSRRVRRPAAPVRRGTYFGSLRVLSAALALAAWMAAGCEAPTNAADHAALNNGYEMLRRTAVVEVYQACKESVVNIGSTRQDASDPHVKHTEYASGVVLHPAGFILTNAHLLRRAGDLAVGFDGGREYPARVVAVDEQHDLAILKIEAERRVKPIALGRATPTISCASPVTRASCNSRTGLSLGPTAPIGATRGFMSTCTD